MYNLIYHHFIYMEINQAIETINTNKSYILSFISLLIAAIYTNDSIQKTNIENEPTDNNTLIIIISALAGIGFFFNQYLQNQVSYFVPVFSIMAIISIVIYVLVTITSSTASIVYYAFGIIGFLSIMVGLALFFYIFSNYLKSISGWKGFFIYLLFYIPCLAIAFVKYIINEFKITPNPALILFIIELILLIMYVILPDVINHISSKDGIPILEGSVFLNKEHTYPIDTTMPDQYDLQIAGNVGNDVKTQRRNYSLSMWTYLNAHSKNNISYNAESLIFDYGDKKPKITYYNSNVQDEKRDIYRIYFTNITTESTDFKPYYELKLPAQRWNNLVFNYSSTHADLFVNGNLERTFRFNQNLPTYSPSDIIKTGSENGLHGAISNIRYYTKTLSNHRITSMYNIFMKKAPPTINL
jgi:hypothetical protein